MRRALVTPGSMWVDVQIEESLPSTNAVLADRAATDARSGLVVIAEHQSQGRGRLDRSWVSPPRAGLTMSALVRPYDVAAPRWPWIALAAGLAVGAALRRTAGVEATLKWPNDVLIADRKVAGILVERVESGPFPPAAVIGIGVNVSLGAGELPGPQATSLAIEQASTTDRSVLARSVLRALENVLGDWQRSGGDPERGLLTAYTQACSTLGQQVRVTVPGDREFEGQAVAVDAVGRLVVRTPAGQRVIGAGDVVHVRSLT